MRTDALIRTLTADTLLDRPPASVLPGALAAGALASVALLFATIGLRPDVAAAFARAVVLLKPLLGLVLSASAVGALLASARPASTVRPRLPVLVVAPVIAATAALLALLALPPGAWGAAFLGKPGSLAQCLVGLPLLSLPLLGATFAALRRGASVRPRLTGALAGLFAGGLGIVVYGFACIEDSPLFFGIWYAVGVGAVGLLGAALGPRVLRF